MLELSNASLDLVLERSNTSLELVSERSRSNTSVKALLAQPQRIGCETCDAIGALRASFRIYAACERSVDRYLVRGWCMASGEAISVEFWTVLESRRLYVLALQSAAVGRCFEPERGWTLNAVDRDCHGGLEQLAVIHISARLTLHVQSLSLCAKRRPPSWQRLAERSLCFRPAPGPAPRGPGGNRASMLRMPSHKPLCVRMHGRHSRQEIAFSCRVCHTSVPFALSIQDRVRYAKGRCIVLTLF